MSSRNFRRVAGKNDLPPPPDDSDEDYQPLYAQRSGNSKYAGLMLSSNSESDHGAERSEEETRRSEEETRDKVAAPNATGAKKKHYKKKGKGKARKPLEELDDIDRSLQEVNAILGAPSPVPQAETIKPNQAIMLLTVDPKHLNVANELRRLFGSDNETNRRTRQPANRALMLKRVLVHPNRDTTVYEFKNTGLSMSKYKEMNNKKYFVFDHSESYQKMHRAFLAKFTTLSTSNLLMTMEEARSNMHVEALLEISDRLFRVEEAGIANEIVENVVTFLQYVAHPLFILTQNDVRLEYKFMENRPFHVAMLKYIYLLTNKACHRTALEIAKMMLIIDPNDPLAIMSILDVLALRAREHEWLIETISYFDRHRDACLLYNIKYSYALAHFHVANKNKQDLSRSNALIREAILAHPEVLLKILECCKVPTTTLAAHVIFERDPKMPWTGGLEELFLIYAKMTSPRWNEPPVMNWLMKNATELCEAYDTDHIVKDDARHWAISRNGLFQVWPPEYLRHVSVLSSMAKLILDAPLTAFYRPTCAWDPLFDKSENRYKYNYKTPSPQNVGVGRSPVYSNDIRNDHLILLTQLAMHTGCFPQFVNFASTEPPGSRRPQPNGTGPNVPGSDVSPDHNNTPGNNASQGANESPGQDRRNSNLGITFTLPIGTFTALPALGEQANRRVVINIPDDDNEQVGVGLAPEASSGSPPDPIYLGPIRPALPVDDTDADDDEREENIEYDYDDDEANYEKYRKALAEAIAAAPPGDETLGGIFKQSDVN
uniref:Transcription factor 25 n=1 Tax=Heliothis virescens TaxID=7102 RepID=A0A2A4JRX8_HELVI